MHFIFLYVFSFKRPSGYMSNLYARLYRRKPKTTGFGLNFFSFKYRYLRLTPINDQLSHNSIKKQTTDGYKILCVGIKCFKGSLLR